MEQNLFELDDKYFDSHWDQMWNTRQRHITNVSQLEDALTLIVDLEDDLSKSNVIEFKKRMCNDLRDACASTQYWTDYSQTALNYLGFAPKDKKEYLDKYWKLIDEIRMVEPTFATDKWCYLDQFGPGLHNSDEIYNYWRKIEAERKAQREKAEAKKRYDEYWKEHADEKKQLDGRISLIDDDIKQLKSSLSQYESRINEIEKEKKSQVPAEDELKIANDGLVELQNQKKALGLFQGKQKKALQEQIDKLTADINNIQNTVKLQRDELHKDVDSRIDSIKTEMKPYTGKIADLENEKSNIVNELKKPR